MSIVARIRPDLLGIKGYSSARMEASGGRVLLNANESPWPTAVDGTPALNRYPEPQPAALVAALARYYEVPAGNLLVGRGSDEAIDLLTRLFCRAGHDAVIIAPPTFGMYAACAEVQGAKVLRMPLDAADGFAYPFDAVRASIDESIKLVYVCTPNNPTGNTVPASAVRALAHDLRDRAMVVVDEAYVEFADAGSLTKEAAKAGNLAALRTLSKAHGLAGARAGVLIADAEVIAFARRIMAPYPVPGLVADAALRALSPDALLATRARISALIAERERMRQLLPRSAGVIDVLPSQANFLTVRFRASAPAFAALLARGIVVRDVSHYTGLANCLRITIGRPDENEDVLDTLRKLRAAA